MRKNDFCVNDKVVGSCWGTVTTFEELDAKKKDDSLGEVKFIQILNEWNGNSRMSTRNCKIINWMHLQADVIKQDRNLRRSVRK